MCPPNDIYDRKKNKKIVNSHFFVYYDLQMIIKAILGSFGAFFAQTNFLGEYHESNLFDYQSIIETPVLQRVDHSQPTQGQRSSGRSPLLPPLRWSQDPIHLGDDRSGHEKRFLLPCYPHGQRRGMSWLVYK